MKKILGVLSFLLAAGLVFAQEGEAAAAVGVGQGLFALGAGLAIGLAAIGTGLAQAAIGSAGAGTIAERPQAFGQVLIYLVIPETIIIFGFVIAFFLYGSI